MSRGACVKESCAREKMDLYSLKLNFWEPFVNESLSKKNVLRGHVKQHTSIVMFVINSLRKGNIWMSIGYSIMRVHSNYKHRSNFN